MLVGDPAHAFSRLVQREASLHPHHYCHGEGDQIQRQQDRNLEASSQKYLRSLFHIYTVDIRSVIS